VIIDAKVISRHVSLTVLLALSLVPASARATIFTWDDFTYANGALAGQGAPPVWAAHSSAGAKPIQVLEGTAALQQSAGAGEDLNKRWLSGLGTGAKTYAGFRVKVKVGSVIGTGEEYFAHFRPAPPDTNSFVARCYAGPAVGGDFTFGITATSVSTTPVVHWPTPLKFERTYRIVIAYDGATGTSTLWVEPTSASSPSVSSTHSSVIGKSLESYALRQATPTGATLTELVDDLVVADSFAEAMPTQSLPVASPPVFVAIAGALGLAGAALISRRRFAAG
jgi:hypothetical protein